MVRELLLRLPGRNRERLAPRMPRSDLFHGPGIEWCTACGFCICCLDDEVNHEHAEYECFTDEHGVCHLRVHEGRACVKPQVPDV